MNNENTIGITGALEFDMEQRLFQTKLEKFLDFTRSLLNGGDNIQVVPPKNDSWD